MNRAEPFSTKLFRHIRRWRIRPGIFAILLVLLTVAVGRSATRPAKSLDATRPAKSLQLQSLAFARYIASLADGDPFAPSRPIAISIEASLPGLYKKALVIAIEAPGEGGRPVYLLLQVEGDGTVLAEVVGRYFKLDKQIENLPPSSIEIAPANYKFHFAGQVNTGETSAFIYRVRPKKNKPALVSGQLWMDSDSGSEVMLTGRVERISAIGVPAFLVRDTKLANGSAYARVTHLTFTLPQLGAAELVVTKFLLPLDNSQPQFESDRSSGGVSFSWNPGSQQLALAALVGADPEWFRFRAALAGLPLVSWK